jgi:2,5-diamino-6-(ribosylamino)-4(3H)-pyrimidinone 5'-phosphate reductase
MDRAYVVMQMGASLDGRIAMAPGLTMFDRHPATEVLPDGDALWEKVAAAIEEQWHPRGIMMGSGTVERENAPLRPLPPYEGGPQALHDDFLPDEVVRDTRTWAIGVDGRGRCRGGYMGTEVPGQHILHLTSHAAPAEHLAFLRRSGIPYLIGGQEHADLAAALRKLYSKLGVRCIRLWGGGTLNGAMLRAGLIDEIHLIIWPAMIGGDATPTLADCADLGRDDRPARLQLIRAEPQMDGQLWVHYRVLR